MRYEGVHQMTNEEFKSEITTLSPKIATLVGGWAGTKISAKLGSLAQTFTNAPDVATAFITLKTDSAKLSAFEAVVATAVTVAAASGSGSPADAYSWVGPIISGIILVGFFILLGILLWRKEWSNIGDIKNVLF